MSEPVHSGTASPAFTAASGFAIAVDVFKTRPLSVARLLAIQTLVFASTGTAQLWLMGYLGRGFEDAATDPVALLQANALISLVSLAASAVSLALWGWIETLWLDLFLRDRSAARLTLGAFFRVMAAFVIVYLIMMGGVFVVLMAGAIIAVPALIAVASEGDPGIVVIGSVMGLAIGLPLFLFLLLVMTRLAALPALAFMEGGMPLGRAWRGARARFWRLTGAWLGWGAIYLVVMAIFGVALFLGPGPFADLMAELMTNPEDPAAQFRAYAAFSRAPGEVAGYWAMTGLANVVFAGLLMVARGIGVGLALDITSREAAGDER